MKLIEMSCTKCGAALQVNPELQKCMCQYCGNEMLIDSEIQKHELVNGLDFGYQQEMGRQKAILELQAQKRAEIQALTQQEIKAREEAARIKQENWKRNAKKFQVMYWIQWAISIFNTIILFIPFLRKNNAFFIVSYTFSVGALILHIICNKNRYNFKFNTILFSVLRFLIIAQTALFVLILFIFIMS